MLAAAACGYKVTSSENGVTTVEISRGGCARMGSGCLSHRLSVCGRLRAGGETETVDYEILAVNAFNSTRKRMSVVARR